MINIKRIVTEWNRINCYLVSDRVNCIIFDPGGDASEIRSYIKQENLKPQAIFLTNCRYDHITAIDQLRADYYIPVYANPLEKDWIWKPELNGSMDSPVICKPAEYDLEFTTYHFGAISFIAIATPGNTLGGVSYIFETFVITGETLLKSGIGRTDLSTSNLPLLLESVEKKLFLLPDNTVVYPFSGETTTIRTEKSVNQFFYKGLSG